MKLLNIDLDSVKIAEEPKVDLMEIPFEKSDPELLKVSFALSAEVDEKPKNVKILQPHEEEKMDLAEIDQINTDESEMLLANAGLRDISNVLANAIDTEQPDRAIQAGTPEHKTAEGVEGDAKATESEIGESQENVQPFGEEDAQDALASAENDEFEPVDEDQLAKIKQPQSEIPVASDATRTLQAQQRKRKKEPRQHREHRKLAAKPTLQKIPEEKEKKRGPQFQSLAAPQL